MKKTICFLLLMCILFGLAGCEEERTIYDYLDYYCYDTHLVALERTRRKGRYWAALNETVHLCEHEAKNYVWYYREILGCSTEEVIGAEHSEGQFVLQNPAYYVDIRKDWTIKEISIVGLNHIFSVSDDKSISGADKDNLRRYAFRSGSETDFGKCYSEGKVTVLGVSNNKVAIDQVYERINLDSNEQYRVSMNHIYESIHPDANEQYIKENVGVVSKLGILVVAFEESDNLIWKTDISMIELEDSKEIIYVIDFGGLDCKVYEHGSMSHAIISPGSELYEWITQVRTSQAYTDYQAIASVEGIRLVSTGRW